ncbi:MAG: tol-pal system YbgF family protein [Kofleriaceae bacterium]
MVLGCRFAHADDLIERLATDDPAALTAAIDAVETAPTSPDLADALYAAARACEDRLHDPARAMTLYERIVRELPDARVTTASQRRLEQLQAELGEHGEHRQHATELAQLIGAADSLPTEQIVQRADALAQARWPGAPKAALWVADWLRRAGRREEAQRRFAEVVTQWAGTAHAAIAIRSGAATAIERGAWDLARELAAQLPTDAPEDHIVRDDTFAAIERGQLIARGYAAAWIIVLAVAFGLASSLAEAVLRGGIRWPSPRPPTEVIFLAPLAATVIAVTMATQPLIASIVITVSLAGLAVTWLSTTALDLVRQRGRATRARALAHALACLLGVLAVAYIAVIRADLIDLLIETARSGPGH